VPAAPPASAHEVLALCNTMCSKWSCSSKTRCDQRAIHPLHAGSVRANCLSSADSSLDADSYPPLLLSKHIMSRGTVEQTRLAISGRDVPVEAHLRLQEHVQGAVVECPGLR